MKYLNLFAFLLLFGVACDTEPDVEDEIEVAFENDYPEALDVDWDLDETTDEYDVTFTDRGEQMTVRYDRMGKKTRVNGADVDANVNINAHSNNVNANVRTDRDIERIRFRTDIPLIETDIDLTGVNNSVRTAIATDYRGWEVHKIKQVEQDGTTYYKVELKDPTGREVKPMYTANGRLVEIDN